MAARVFELSEGKLPSVIAWKNRRGKNDCKTLYYIPIFYFRRYVNKRCDIIQIIHLENGEKCIFNTFLY